MVVLDKHVTAKTVEERFAAVKVMHLRHLEDRREFSLCLLKEASRATELLLNPCLRRLDTMARRAAAASALGTSSNAAPASTPASSSVAAMPGTSSTKAATASVPRQQSCGAEVL